MSEDFPTQLFPTKTTFFQKIFSFNSSIHCPVSDEV